jgi:hypothetical protein
MLRFEPNGIMRIISRLIMVVAEEKEVSYRLFMPESLRARFKSLCALKGVTMNEVLVQLVQRWIAENQTPPDQKS